MGNIEQHGGQPGEWGNKGRGKEGCGKRKREGVGILKFFFNINIVNSK